MTLPGAPSAPHTANARTARSSSLKLAGSKRQFVRWRGRASENSTHAKHPRLPAGFKHHHPVHYPEPRAMLENRKHFSVAKSNLHPAERRSHLPRHPGPAATWRCGIERLLMRSDWISKPGRYQRVLLTSSLVCSTHVQLKCLGMMH